MKRVKSVRSQNLQKKSKQNTLKPIAQRLSQIHGGTNDIWSVYLQAEELSGSIESVGLGRKKENSKIF